MRRLIGRDAKQREQHDESRDDHKAASYAEKPPCKSRTRASQQ